MYAWLWQHLPGPTPVRALVAIALVVVVVALCFVWVFPWVADRLPVDNLDQQAAPAPVTTRGIA